TRWKERPVPHRSPHFEDKAHVKTRHHAGCYHATSVESEPCNCRRCAAHVLRTAAAGRLSRVRDAQLPARARKKANQEDGVRSAGSAILPQEAPAAVEPLLPSRLRLRSLPRLPMPAIQKGAG